MTRFLRLSLLALALGAPALMAAPASASSLTAALASFDEVAQASDGTTQARPQRTRRPTASARRRHGQTAHRARRPRAAQG